MQIPAVRDVCVLRGTSWPRPTVCASKWGSGGGRPTRLECLCPQAHSLPRCSSGSVWSGFALLVWSSAAAASKGSMEMEAGGQASHGDGDGDGMGVSGSPARRPRHTHNTQTPTLMLPAAADCERARFGWVAGERGQLFSHWKLCSVVEGWLPGLPGIVATDRPKFWVRSTRPYRTVH